MEKYPNSKRLLIICLIVELVTLLGGLEFFNPFPISEIGESHLMVGATFVLFGLSYAYGVIVADVSGIIDANKHMGYFVLACLFLAFVSPIWPILLIVVIVFTIVMLATTKSKSSKS